MTFVQLSATAFGFRDAVRFSNGRELLLQELQCGQHVDVLSVSSSDLEHEEGQKLKEEYQRISYDEPDRPNSGIAIVLRTWPWDCL